MCEISNRRMRGQKAVYDWLATSLLVLAKMSVELCSENFEFEYHPFNVQNSQKIDKLLKSFPNGRYGSAPLITVSVMHQDCITALKKSSQIAVPNSQNGTVGC